MVLSIGLVFYQRFSGKICEFVNCFQVEYQNVCANNQSFCFEDIDALRRRTILYFQ